MLDYIVVGMGLSGLAVTCRLDEKNKEFMLFEDSSQKSSLVAAGLINPVALKRFSLAWRADEQLKLAIPFYRSLEEKLQARIFENLNIYRKFQSVEEQNNWFEASDKPKLAAFLDTKLTKQINPNIKADFCFGRVLQTGKINTDVLLKEYRKLLQARERIQFEGFRYDVLKVSKDYVEYKGYRARKIVFCEGFGLKKNPFFNYLPLRGNKGEYIVIRAEQLKLKEAVKSSKFIIPIGEDLYKVGATYNNKDKDPVPTPEARKELEGNLNDLLDCEYEIVDQQAGIRPATADRRPLVGCHPEHSHMFCCNGFGSRGILIAPQISAELVEFAEHGSPLSPEVDLDRFTRKHFKR